MDKTKCVKQINSIFTITDIINMIEEHQFEIAFIIF